MQSSCSELAIIVSEEPLTQLPSLRFSCCMCQRRHALLGKPEPAMQTSHASVSLIYDLEPVVRLLKYS